MSLWGSGWMHVGSWWEVLLAAPGAAAWVLKVRWRRGLVKKGRVQASRTAAAPTGSQGHDGIVVLVDPGAQEAPPQAAFHLWLQGGHLPWEEFVPLVVWTPVPAPGRHTVPCSLTTQALHV